MNVLTLDFGNTRKKMGIFVQSQLIDVQFLQEENWTSVVNEAVLKYQIQSISVADVTNTNQSVWQEINPKTQVLFLESNPQLPIKIEVQKPETIGSDRIAAVIAALHTHPKKHVLVISLGTCITYNFINRYGQFLGGAISLGISMRFQALHQFTAKLPLEKPTNAAPLIGFNTSTSIQSGVLMGTCMEIEGFISAYQARYNQLQVIYTGGDYPFIQPNLSAPHHYEPNLTHLGLFQFSKINTAL